MSVGSSSVAFETAFAHAPLGMALVDTSGHVEYVNAALCRIVGHDAEAICARPFSALSDPDDVEVDAREAADLLAGRIDTYHIEKRYLHANGHRVWVLMSVSLVRDVGGAPLLRIVQVQDISARKELEGRLEHLVDHDLLTGLFNAPGFEKALTRETRAAARYGGSGAVLLIDVDHFKEVNDEFGHKAGDGLLKSVAAVLSGRIRETDVIARLGGDEFGILLPRVNPEQAQASADGLVKALRRHKATLADRQIPITVSVGVAMFDCLTDVEIMAAADLAMYEAKEAGRDQFAVYRPTIEGPARWSSRLVEAERIQRAITHDQLALHGQPVVDLATGAVDHYELLLRLRTDDNQLLPPSAFLYVAERFGSIVAIDAWVIGQACARIAALAATGPPLRLSVNVSAKSIGNPELIQALDRALGEWRIDPARLIVELTETAAIGHVDQAKTFLAELRSRGCRMALDDLGAGFGSFHYVKHLPFDYFKIDADFVRGCAANTGDRLVVEAMAGIARGLGTRTVAKCVTDEATAISLRRSGIDFAQGFHLGAPRPIDEILRSGSQARAAGEPSPAPQIAASASDA